MTVHDSLNRANPNSLADMLRKVSFGDVLAQSAVQTVRRVNMDAAGTNPGNVATVDVLVLPDFAKASHILRAYARAGTAGTGEMTVASKDATPATGEIAVAPNGNIVTLAADAITEVDITYVPEGNVTVVESVFPAASDSVAVPTPITDRGLVAVLEAEVVEGTGTGNKIVLTAGGSPSAGQCAMSADGTTVEFAAADAVARVRLKLLVAKPVAAQLQGALLADAVTV